MQVFTRCFPPILTTLSGERILNRKFKVIEKWSWQNECCQHSTCWWHSVRTYVGTVLHVDPCRHSTVVAMGTNHSNSHPWNNGPLNGYVKLRLVHAPGIPGTISRHRLQMKPLVSDPGMHHGTCMTHVPWCMAGSLTRGGGENVPGIPGACTTTILRIW